MPLADAAIARSAARSASPQTEWRAIAAVCLGWVLLVAALGGALQMITGPLRAPTAAALVVIALPGLLSLILAAGVGPRRRAILLVAWAAAGAGACGLTGGLSGPLTPWCLAPVAVAALIGRRRLMAEAAALAVMAAVLAALAQIAGLAPAAPDEPVRFCLSLFALASLGFSLAAGLVRASDEERAPEGLEHLLMEQPHLILALDRDGRVRSAYGFAPPGVAEATLLRRGLRGIVVEEDFDRLGQALEGARRAGRTDVALTPAADPRRSLTLSLRATADGGLFAVMRDATAERAHEAGLIDANLEAEALNSGKSRFLANMSHELRTPLNTIMGFSDIMRSRLFGPLSPKYGEYAELIHESGRHLLDLINDVLDMSKIEAESFQLQLERLDARDPVAAALRLIRVQADEAGLALRAGLPSEPLEVQADPRALKQIALNLLSNALKFTPRGGQVTVTLASDGDSLELVVTDTGVGIAQEDLKRLGRPYQQAGDAGQRAKGTGLGLSLVRGLAELHGGAMIIESTLGEGTSVLVRLPGVVVAGPVDEPPGGAVIAFNPQR